MDIVLSVAIVGSLLFIPACRKARRLGDPLDRLTSERRDEFDWGRAEFERVFNPEIALGPLFTADALAACHENPVSG